MVFPPSEYLFLPLITLTCLLLQPFFIQPQIRIQERQTSTCPTGHVTEERSIDRKAPPQPPVSRYTAIHVEVNLFRRCTLCPTSKITIQMHTGC